MKIRGLLMVVVAAVFLLQYSSICQSANPAFDRIRPIAEKAASALQAGDSLKALSLYTEALVRGQEWPKTSDEETVMSQIVGNIIPLRMKLKNENVQRLALELMIRPGIEAVYREQTTFGGSPDKLPALGYADNDNPLPQDSMALRLSNTVDLMATDRLKESEKALISLYTHTWKRGLNAECRHSVANKLGLLYLKLETNKQALDILCANKLDMDLKNTEINIDYTECLFYLALALRDDNLKIIGQCYLETANELAERYNLNVEPIIDDFKRIFTQTDSKKDNSVEEQIERFIKDNDKNLSFLTESQREKRWENIKDKWTHLKQSLVDSNGGIIDINACLNAFQYEKQIMLRSAAKTMEALKGSGDEEAIALTDSLIKIRQRLAKPWTSNEKELKAEYERCQKRLLHHHVMNDFDAHLFKMLKAEEIASKLRGDETFVDFGTLPTIEGDRYFAILISPRTPRGRIIPLCTVDEMDNFIKNTHDEEARKMVEKRYGSDFLYEKLWRPIKTGGLLNERIYYSPTGLLDLIMPDAISHNGKYLAEDFEFHILSSADAIGSVHAGKYYVPYKIYSLCAIDYYCDRLALIANARMYGAERPIMADIIEKDTDVRFAFSDPNSIPPLHSPEDFNWLKDLCEEQDVPTLIATKHNASEHGLRYLSGHDIGVLNIVTHAFSLPKTIGPLDKPYFSVSNAKTRLNEDNVIEILPLYRTGIMLSGAERAWCQRNVISGIEDGIANGEELASLDLSGADLITLIACDTGNGDIDEEEGILGLRRALKLAGCRSLVTTAWNLDKEAGDAYLKEFYTNLLQGSGISKAHRNAQLELIKRFDNPYYWGVFQLID